MIVKRLQIRPWMFKKEILILYYGLNDQRTGLLAKLPAVLSVIYLLSPIDLIPDFIPFLGYVDDLLVVPLLMNLAIRFLPADVREESLLKANRNKKKFSLLIFLLMLLLIALLLGIFFLIRHLFKL
jgi:uncharacterized membrane protein YkvA (DUF1232 family)